MAEAGEDGEPTEEITNVEGGNDQEFEVVMAAGYAATKKFLARGSSIFKSNRGSTPIHKTSSVSDQTAETAPLDGFGELPFAHEDFLDDFEGAKPEEETHAALQETLAAGAIETSLPTDSTGETREENSRSGSVVEALEHSQKVDPSKIIVSCTTKEEEGDELEEGGKPATPPPSDVELQLENNNQDSSDAVSAETVPKENETAPVEDTNKEQKDSELQNTASPQNTSCEEIEIESPARQGRGQSIRRFVMRHMSKRGSEQRSLNDVPVPKISFK